MNSSHKIFAKVLQIRLQGLLLNVIHDDQSAFLPLQFILDNILIQHETIASQARESLQDLIILKLDFTKAYDVVSWRVLFAALERMDLLVQFVQMVRILFSNTRASISLNGEID